jgi:uncharacterized protein YaiI (UPF0178 family)
MPPSAASDGESLVAVFAGDHRVPQRQVDVAPQFHLEIDGVALDAFDGREGPLEARVVRRVEGAAQAAEQHADAGQRRQRESLRIGQPPLIDAAHQQGQAQGTRLVVRRRTHPVAGARADLDHGRLQRRLVAFESQAEDAREGVLCHARGEALHLGRGQCGQVIRRRHEAAAATIAHTSLPSSKPALCRSGSMPTPARASSRKSCIRAATRHSLPVILVANQWLRVPPSPWIRSVQVPKGFDVADNHIVEQAAAGDLVVTADIPLAALVIEKRAFALNPRGEFYTAENIRQVLDMRNFMDTLRSSGVDTGGPPTFSHADRQSFANQLDRFIAGRRRPAGPNAPA